jgi:tetratricopeptide (TPR) repeat protein
MSIQEVPLISQYSIFSALPEESQRFLQDRMRRVDYPAGAMIVRAGMRSDYMAVVVSGALELRAVSGEVQLIGEGGIWGQAMMRYAAPSAFSVLAVRPTTLWIIGRSDWLAANSLARQQSERPPRRSVKADPKNLASALVGRRKQSFPEESPHNIQNLRPTPGQAGLIRNPPFLLLWKFLVALLVVGMMLVVIGPAFVGWIDFTLVRLCLQAQKPGLAESYLTLALSGRPDSAVLQDALGYVRYLQVKPDQALQEFSRAVELEPDLASARNNLGVALLARGNASQALPHLQAAVDLDPGNATAYVNLGNAYLAIGNPAEAMKAYQDAFTLDPSQATAQAHWAILALKQGRVADARRILQKAAAVDPLLVLARLGLGVAALIEGRPIAALPELEAARRLNPQDPSTNLYLGLAFKELDRPMDAAIQFIQVLSLSQDPQILDLARENLQQVYNKLIPGETSGNNETLPDGLLQKGGASATDQ